MGKSIIAGLRAAFLILAVVSGCSGTDTDSTDVAAKDNALKSIGAVTLEELAGWTFLGTGEAVIDNAENALRMSETEGSVGVTLVSPGRYGVDVVMRFDVKPSSYESVNVVILSASDVSDGGDLNVPGEYDGGFGFWTAENVQDYIVAFHNGAHNRKPFIIRSPEGDLLVEGDSHVVGEQWHSVEVGRSGGRVWLSVDGVNVIEATDDSGDQLPGGHVAFRLRGTPDALASAWFRNVRITAE